MSLNLNRVLLAGNLTRDPIFRFFPNDTAVADFGLAMNRRWKGRDGQLQEEVTFVDVECWGSTAEFVGKFFTKGRPCFVEGRLKLDSWEDKGTGQKRSRLKVVADTVLFTDSKREGGAASAAAPSGDAPQAGPRAADHGSDEPPF